MKRTTYTLLALALACNLTFGQTRYIDKVFDNVEMTPDVQYGTNISILPIVLGQSDSPAPVELLMDVYHPSGDSLEDRPVVILAHAGDFLPQYVNTSPIGTKRDSAVVEFCREMALRGYVAVSMGYRLGWNPFGNEKEIKETVLQATYRISQDMHNVVRYLRKSVAEDDNPYGISGEHFAVGGFDGAAWCVNNMAYLKTIDQAQQPKFVDIGAMPAVPFLIEELHGNPQGTNVTPLNLANHAEYSSDIDVVINWQGGVGDFDWISAGDVPTINFIRSGQQNGQSIRDVTIDATGSIIIVEGAFPDTISHRANELGNNDVFKDLDDELGQAGRDSTGGLEGMYVYTPASQQGQDPVQCVNQAGVNPVGFGNNTYPWNWYNEDAVRQVYTVFEIDANLTADEYICNWNTSRGNPNNADTSRAIIDIMSRYMAPRIHAAMGLGETTNVHNLAPSSVGLEVFPNPSHDRVQVRAVESIRQLNLYDMQGRLVTSASPNNRMQEINVDNLAPGMYILRTTFDAGVTSTKLEIGQ
ncbi:MAG: T9SS type A sorting domain-containing protein [Saprospiraceae bacterium]|nr:T9SS type A sorting domain-containing protein [Saprospiraceae bacterium]